MLRGGHHPVGHGCKCSMWSMFGHGPGDWPLCVGPDGLPKSATWQIEQYRALARDAESIKADRELTAALIERLIDRIEVSHDKQIKVCYRFQSEFENYVEVLK